MGDTGDRDWIIDIQSRNRGCREFGLWVGAISSTAVGLLAIAGGSFVGFLLLAAGGALLISLLIEQWWSR